MLSIRFVTNPGSNVDVFYSLKQAPVWGACRYWVYVLPGKVAREDELLFLPKGLERGILTLVHGDVL